MRISIFIVSLLLAVSSSVNAQALLSRNLVNGRMIEVFDDFSWRYEDATEFDCVRISQLTEICDFEPDWTLTPINSVNLYLDFYFDELNYTRIVPFGAGGDIGYTLEFLIENLILDVAEYNGIDKEDIAIQGTFESEVLGQPAQTVAYSMTINGLRLFIYATFWIGETESIQVFSQNYDLEINGESLDRHTNFVSKIKFRQ